MRAAFRFHGWIAVALILAVTGCYKTVERFEAQIAVESPLDTPDFGRALLHQGLPEADRVALWYILPTSTPDYIDAAPTVSVAKMAPGTISHSTWRSAPVGRIEVLGLQSDTRYDLTVRLREGAEPLTVSARTAPESVTGFSFVTYSAMAPYEPRAHRGPLVRRRTVRALGRLRDAALAAADPSAQSVAVDGFPVGRGPSFAIVTGNLVSVDGGASPFWPLGGDGGDLLAGPGSARHRYRRARLSEYFEALYRRTLAIPPLDDALAALPHIMMWDDGEIRDGWGEHGDEEAKLWPEHLSAARAAFLGYQALRNPKAGSDTAWGSDPASEIRLVGDRRAATSRPELDFDFAWGAGASFLVMDLRSARAAPHGPRNPRIAGDEQLRRIAAWLARGARSESAPGKVFILASSIPLTEADFESEGPLASALRAMRDRLLDILAAHFRERRRDRLVIVSGGDARRSELIALSLRDAPASADEPRIFGWEVVSSGLAQQEFQPARGRRERAPAPAWIWPGIEARSFGRLVAPSFAEIFIAPPVGAGAPPRVGVRFYPISAGQGEDLAAPPRPARIGGAASALFDVVALSEERAAVVEGSSGGADRDRAFFARFLQPDPCTCGVEWDAVADGWYERPCAVTGRPERPVKPPPRSRIIGATRR